MTDVEALISDLREKAGKATAGPWSVDPKAAEESFFEDVNVLTHYGLAVAVAVHNGDIIPPQPEANAAYIAAANPASILALIADRETMKRERDERQSKALEMFARAKKAEADLAEAVKALERLNNWWLENHPGGPDGDRSLAGGFGKLADDTIAIWRAIQAAIPNAKHKEAGE